MNEVQYLKDYYQKYPSRNFGPVGGQDSPTEVAAYSPSPIGSHEAQSGNPSVVDKLGIEKDYRVDFSVELKVMAIDQYIKNTIEDEGLRDSEVSYDTILSRMLGRIGMPVEQTKRQGKGLNVLEILFQEVALSERMSGATFFRTVKEKFREAKAELLKQQLKEALATL